MSERARKLLSAASGILEIVSSAVLRITSSESSSSSTRIDNCSSALGASAPCAARSRTSLGTSPRLKKSSRGVGAVTELPDAP